MKRQTTMYCKMCKEPLKVFIDNIHCKCKTRIINTLSEYGIPSNWQGKREITEKFGLRKPGVDYGYK